MNNEYTEINIMVADEDLRSQLIAQLEAIGCYGFEEDDNSLKAYINAGELVEPELNNLLNKYDLNYSISVISDKNWNEIWESNFQSVLVDDFVGIRAGFHAPLTGVEHEIVITPKMSFGTGHHATTWLVMQLMRELDFSGKKVFDFGTGTGILAILAWKLGAMGVLAGDNDPWCIENASENISNNNCDSIDIQQIDSADLNQQFGIILANINRHIILANLGFLYKILSPGGELVLSGLLIDDEKDICEAAMASGFRHLKTVQRNGWIAIRLFKE